MTDEPMLAGKTFVLAGADDHDLTKLSEYESIGGYQALVKARAMTPDAVIEQLKESQLRGRGGAFFATGLKWSFVPKPDAIPKPHYLVVNADESEPGSFKDNEILSRVPHRFIEGCLITAHAVESKSVFVYVRGEYTGPYAILVAALQELEDRARHPRRRLDARAPRRRRVYLRRGDGAPRVARGQARPAADEAAVPRRPGSLRVPDRRQQRRDDDDRAAGDRDRREGVRDARSRELDRDARRLDLGPRRQRRELRDRERDVAARDHRGARGRRPGGPQAEGGDPRRLVDGDPQRRRDRRRLRLRLARPRRARRWARRGSSASTNGSAWCSSVSASPSSTSTSRAASAPRVGREPGG